MIDNILSLGIWVDSQHTHTPNTKMLEAQVGESSTMLDQVPDNTSAREMELG